MTVLLPVAELANVASEMPILHKRWGTICTSLTRFWIGFLRRKPIQNRVKLLLLALLFIANLPSSFNHLGYSQGILSYFAWCFGHDFESKEYSMATEKRFGAARQLLHVYTPTTRRMHRLTLLIYFSLEGEWKQARVVYQQIGKSKVRKAKSKRNLESQAHNKSSFAMSNT